MGLSKEEIYRRHVQDLTRFGTSLVGPSEAGDVVAEAVMRVMASNRWDEVRDHRAYLYRAVLNEAPMLARSSSRRRTRGHQVRAWEQLSVADIVVVVGCSVTAAQGSDGVSIWQRPLDGLAILRGTDSAISAAVLDANGEEIITIEVSGESYEDVAP